MAGSKHVWFARQHKAGWMCALHSSMWSWARCSPTINPPSAASHLFIFLFPIPSIFSVCVCACAWAWACVSHTREVTQSGVFDSAQKTDDERRGDIHFSQAWDDKHSPLTTTTADDATHVSSISQLLRRSLRKLHITRMENVFCTEYAAFR